MHTTAHLTSLSFQASPASNDCIPPLWMGGCQISANSSPLVQPWKIPHPALHVLLMLHGEVAPRVSPYFLPFLVCRFQMGSYFLCRLERKSNTLSPHCLAIPFLTPMTLHCRRDLSPSAGWGCSLGDTVSPLASLLSSRCAAGEMEAEHSGTRASDQSLCQRRISCLGWDEVA